MLYREAGQFKTTYAADQQLFPIRQDRIGIAILLAVVFAGVPLAAATPAIAGAIDFNYWFSGVLIPFLIFSLAALGLNILTGYAAQFFVVWVLTKFGWISNYSSSGVITAQKLVVFGYAFDTPVKRYVLVLAIVCVMALAAKNMVRSSIGRAWMAVRDMDV